MNPVDYTDQTGDLPEPASVPLMNGEWLETSAGIMYVVSDRVQFEDDFSHWQNGVCRLLEISDRDARALIEATVDAAVLIFGRLPSEISPQERCVALEKAVRTQFNFQSPPGTAVEFPQSSGTTFDGRPANTIFAGSISGNRERLVIGCREAEYGWQLDALTNQPVAASSVVYDRAYYDTPRQAHCGMKDYIKHEDWRTEKARRLMRTFLNAAKSQDIDWLKKPESVHALDVGSATGYYRKAMSECGFHHYGIDLSEDAIAVCRETLGYDTWHGSVFDLPKYVDAQERRFNLITLWDTIEHLDDPGAVVRLLESYLSDGGVLLVRTPSLTALEAEILGDMYYSYKFDHIRYFSPRSLQALMDMCGLTEIYIETTSHIFKGMLGANYLYQVGKELRGADIVGLYMKN